MTKIHVFSNVISQNLPFFNKISKKKKKKEKENMSYCFKFVIIQEKVVILVQKPEPWISLFF